MYFTPRSALVRNVAVAVVNGAITYIILIIAPLGLMAVIINTALVVIATYVTATTGDRIMAYLQGDRTPQRIREHPLDDPAQRLETRQPDDRDRLP
jgi:hypothetical protein